jgi:hypothetical protein
MVRVKMSFNASRVQKKAAALDSELRSRLKSKAPSPSSNNSSALPSRDEREARLRHSLEPVKPGFYDYIERRSRTDPDIHLTSKKIGPYKVNFPNMADTLGEAEKFVGEKELLGPSPDAREAFDKNNWQEPDRLVVPQDVFDSFLDQQERQESSSGLWGKTWKRLLGVSVFAWVTPRGLKRFFSSSGSAEQAKANIREIAKEAVEKVGL